ncbi:MAG: tetratricopeptide repeat protein [Candidatus Thorarchaeota archaeon]
MANLDTNTIRELLREAKVLTTKKEYVAALAKYSQVLEIDPKSVSAWYFKAIVHKKLGQDEDAARCGQKTVELDAKWAPKIAAILSSTKDSGHQTQRLQKTKPYRTRGDKILDRFHQALFIDGREVFDKNDWDHCMGFYSSRTRDNRTRILRLLDLLSESKDTDDAIIKKLHDYVVDALLQGYYFFVDKDSLTEKSSQTLTALGFQTDDTRLSHLSGSPVLQTLASVYCSFVEKIEGGPKSVMRIEPGFATAQPSWFIRDGMLAVTSKSLYAVGPLGFMSGGKTSVLFINVPWKPYHRHVDVYPLDALNSYVKSHDEKWGECLLLEFEGLYHFFAKEVEKKKFMAGIQTVVDRKVRNDRLTLKLCFRYDDKELAKIRLEELAKTIESTLGQT